MERDVEDLKRGVVANTSMRKGKGAGNTCMVWDDDAADDMYGGGRRGAKR